MKLKEKLLNIKKELLLLIQPTSRDFEFNATLEDHLIGNQNVYRLYYVNYSRIFEYSGCRDDNSILFNWSCKPFMMPDGMTREEGFKVLSYLTDFIEKRDDIGTCSLTSVETLDDVLDLEEFKFKRIVENDKNRIIDLFTVTGRLLLFKNSELYSKYFEWYTSDVTLEEVKNIYAKYNMLFPDVAWFDDQKEKDNAKVLKISKHKW